MMKKLLLLLVMPFSIICMDAPAQEITYEGPQQAYNDNGYEINAKDGLFTIGWITYDYYAGFAEISTLFVDKDDQRKGIGSNLFKKCIQHLIANGCSSISWTASAFANVELEELRTIYSKLIQKLESANSYQLQTTDIIESGIKKIKMTLMVKKN
jgi:GNAT superfamily N-acetyltransferase